LQDPDRPRWTASENLWLLDLDLSRQLSSKVVPLEENGPTKLGQLGRKISWH
jgi:hypothetical protein